MPHPHLLIHPWDRRQSCEPIAGVRRASPSPPPRGRDSTARKQPRFVSLPNSKIGSGAGKRLPKCSLSQKFISNHTHPSHAKLRAVAKHRFFRYSHPMSATLSNPRARVRVRYRVQLDPVLESDFLSSPGERNGLWRGGARPALAGSTIPAPEPPNELGNPKMKTKTPLCPSPIFGSSSAGFSLVELLITVALLIVITTLYFGFSSPSRQRSAQKSCAASLQKIFLAQEIYAQDHAGKFPGVAGAIFSGEPLDLLVPRYSADREIFHCPGSQAAPLPPDASLRTNKISYAYYQGRRAGGGPAALMSDAQVNTNSKTAGDAIFSATGKPPGNNHHQFGGNILFTDGRVETSATNLVMALPLTSGVMLLNPRP